MNSVRFEIEDRSPLPPNLVRDPFGYWTTPFQGDVSYPQEGNENSFQLEEHSFWFRHRNGIIADTMRIFPPNGLLFDVGGGNGYVAIGLEAAGFPCVLVEPGRVGAGNAVKRGVKHVVCSTVEAANFQSGSLAAVGLFDVLEHIQDHHRFLQGLRSLLIPGGRIYITVPAFQVLWSKDDDYAGHHRRYTATSLRKSLETAGFIVEHVSYFFWFLPLPILFSRTIPGLLGIPRSTSAEDSAKEHSSGKGVLNWAVDRALQIERGLVRRGHRLPFGGSCIAVAQRPKD